MDPFEESITRLKLAVAIQTTQMLLEQRQRETDELEQRLTSMKSQCVSLADELQVYTLQRSRLTGQNQVTRSRRRTSLLNLPDELLCEIFEYATYLCHPSIRSLLLVCKRLHRIITGTSSLWTRIDIIFPEDLLQCFSPTKEYVEACLERSRGRLLDITIKHPLKCSSTEYVLEWIANNMTPVIGEAEVRSLRSTLYGADWECGSPLVEERVAHVNGVINSLSGARGEHISRWGSLSITLPAGEQGGFQVSCMEGHSASNLKRLEITNIGSMDDDTYVEMSLSEMPCLRSLKLDRHSLFWFNPLPTSITHLDTVYGEGAIFNHLVVLQHLHHLCIRDANNSFDTDAEDPITLPSLSELHIHGQCDRIFGILVAPRLERLHVWSSEATGVTQTLPSVPSIEWTLEANELDEALDLSRCNMLSSILKKVTKTDRLSLRGFSVEMVDELSDKLKRAGEISTSLKTVEVLTDDASIVVCDWVAVDPV